MSTVVAFAALGAARPARAAGEFAVNAYATGHQTQAAAARLAGGDFVIAWSGPGMDDDYGVWVRRFDLAGAPQGSDVRVNTYTTGFQARPSVAADAGGGFVVVWTSYLQDGADGGVFGRRFDALGAPVGGEFQANTFTTGRQYLSAVAASPAGGFVVTWSSFQGDGSHFGIAARRYDATGAPLGGEFQVNTYTTYVQSGASVAFDGAGRFVVVWQSAQDGSNWGVFGQRFDASGAALGLEFAVNTYTTGFQSGPAVSADAAGNFVVAWTGSADQDGEGGGVFAQQFDALGAAQGGEFRVNTYTAGDQGSPEVGWDEQGNFVVSWTDEVQDGSSYAVFTRRFDLAGAQLGPEFRTNAYTTGRQSDPAVAVTPDGGFLVAWTDSSQLGNNNNLFGRIVPDLIFADGVESGGLGAWSSAATDGGDLSVSPAAALDGPLGLQALVDDTAGLYVQDDSPDDEGRYRARFWLDPNGFDPGESAGKRRTRVLLAFQEAPTRRLMAVVLRRIGGQYALMGRARRDDNSQANTGFFAITDAPHAVEVAWTRASTPDAGDGRLDMWIDGALVSTLIGLDNHASGIDFARLGALSVKTTAAGTLFFDAFDSRRASYIGP